MSFIVAKAMDDAERARDSLVHLRRYLELLLKPAKDTSND
jgi:hypothetical protein